MKIINIMLKHRQYHKFVKTLTFLEGCSQMFIKWLKVIITYDDVSHPNISGLHVDCKPW